MKRQNLGELLAERAYSCPPDQRGYSWKPKHVNDFLEDLSKAHDKKKTHQFGLIVTYDPATQSQPAQIIDGQQRITTALLFLICTRNFFYKHQKNHTAKKHFQNITKTLFGSSGEPDDPRLTLSKINNTLFQKMLTEPEFKKPLAPKPTGDNAVVAKSEFGDESNELLLSAFSRMNPKLKKFAVDATNKPNFNKAYEYVETLLERFSVLITSTTNYDEIYTMFDLINNRGVKLSPADQVKAYLLSKVEQNTDDKKIVEKYEEKWRDIANNVTNRTGSKYKLEKFLNHYLIITKFNRPTSVPKPSELYDGFETLVSEDKENIPPEMIIDELVAWSETFEKIRLAVPAHFESPNVIHYLKKMNKMRVVYAYPVILGGHKKYWKDYDDFKSFDALVSLCCKYHLRKRIMAMGNMINNRQYEKKLYDILKQIHDRKKLENIIERTMIDKYPTDDDLRPKLKTMNFTDPDFTIAVLEEAEYSGMEKRSRDDTTLEHIMPEDTTNWEKDILAHKPKADKPEDYINLFRERYYNALGNLTLLSKENNASASHKAFDEKKIMYDSEPTYKITTKLIDIKQWDGQAIEKRSKTLAEKILVETDIIKIRKRLESRQS